MPHTGTERAVHAPTPTQTGPDHLADPLTSGKLPTETQTKMEASFASDFSDVTVHQDGAASALGARAFASGNELHFAPGEYAPGTPDGDRLIGHELSHTVQQRQGRAEGTQFSGLEVNLNPGLEAEADRAGARAARGEPAGISSDGTASRPVIQGDFDRVHPNSQVIDLDQDEDAYAHYSFDVVKDQDGGNNLKDNDHLTIENSLAALLMTQNKDEAGVERFREGRKGKTKRGHNDLLNAYGLTQIDNFNFRPKDQGPTAISAGLDGTSGLRTATGGRKDTASAKVDVEEQITLTRFIAWLRTMMDNIGVDGALRDAILASMERVRARMGVAADDLALNATQKLDFTKFVLLAEGAGGTLRGRNPPAILMGLIAAKPVIRLKKADMTPAIREALPARVLEAVDAKHGDEKTYVLKEGEEGFVQLQTHLINSHWPTIRGWVVTPPG